MKKILITVLFTLTMLQGYTQEIYFLTGKNHTNYKIRYTGSELINNLEKKGDGDSYEIGLALPIKVQRLAFDNNLNYTIGLTLNQYNAVAGDLANNYIWKTEYIGIQNALIYSFVRSNHIDLALKGGINLSTMLYGNQTINNSRFNLNNQRDFNGLVLTPVLGIRAKCNLSEYGYLSLGYNYSKSTNLTNDTNKKLSFLTHQILFGISFELY
ncbi:MULTISPECIES: hypothetical protein [Flavobacterium]|uniref:Outer membrane protein beta-barrel domain-containing protein n=1 Tax=Flavobacterium keumense TaxID=1306518 RepID=A0ABY8NA29_9FLAO|nr:MULTISPECIES: hypothetical protein [Flavobacterium]WGK95082.1 hypothetical protein MG292_02320 [Flavobacterium keumense]